MIKLTLNKIKTKFFNWLRSKGYEVVKITNINVSLQELIRNRVLLSESMLNSQRLFCEMPVDKGRFFNQIIKDDKCCYPAVSALEEINKSDELGQEYLSQKLIEFSKKNQNLSYASFLELEGTDSVFSNLPAWSRILPWQPIDDIKKAVKQKNFSTGIENAKRGLKLDALNGGSQFPLSSDTRAKFEAVLLFKLNKSIKQSGFDSKKNLKEPMGCVLLIGNDGDFAWISNVGIHRITVLAAQGMTHIPLNIRNIIYRDTVKDWHMVRNGLMDESMALEVFDKILKGRH